MENKKIYLLYAGDAWLSRESRLLMGVFSDFDKAVDAAVINATYKSPTMEQELVNGWQTRGLYENWIIIDADLDDFAEGGIG